MSPFDHAEDIARVEPLTVRRTGGKEPNTVTLGAVITVRAVPGLTEEGLQRIVDCHLARNAAMGHDVPEMPDCPLVPKGARASVSSTGEGFAVTVRARRQTTAKEILARAGRLAAVTSLEH